MVVSNPLILLKESLDITFVYANPEFQVGWQATSFRPLNRATVEKTFTAIVIFIKGRIQIHVGS